MSLIVTSSNQSQYGGRARVATTRTLAGIEAPSSYQNHFTSPLKIPANAEVAVESVKIRRDALLDIEDETLMYHYFGHLQDDTEAGDLLQQRVEMPIPIRPRPGSYNVDGWVKELEKRLNDSYHNPEIYGQFTVTNQVNASGQTTGISISCEQLGSSQAASLNQAGASHTSNLLSSYWQAPYQLSDGKVPVTDWTSVDVSASGAVGHHKLFTRLIATGSGSELAELDTRDCSVIGHGHPFGLVEGKFKVNVTGSKNNGWRVGLSRPQIEYIRDTTKPGARGRANLLPGTRHPDGGFDDNVAISTRYNMYNPSTGRYQKDFYDYMIQDDGVNIEIYQLSYDNEVYTNQLAMSEVVYYGAGMAFANKLTKADFNASYESVEFKSVGDEIELYFEGTVGGQTKVVSSAVSAVRNKCFLPIGETRNALYPRLNISQQDDYLQIFHYSSHYSSTETFRFPSFNKDTTTFTVGDDFYSNNRVPRFAAGKHGGDLNKAVIQDTKDRPYCLSQTLICDTKSKYEINSVSAETRTSTFDGEISGHHGIDKNHAFIIGFIEPGDEDYYLEGKYATTETSGRAKMNGVIGFVEKSFIDQVEGVANGYTTVNSQGDIVTFNSFAAPSFRVHSAFVRISNFPIQSFNGNKQSVSKILYHLPRFENGSQKEYGDLFFAPGEKTYVALHNPGPLLLNNIEVQIVDVEEKPIDDISGNTIIVFHIREKK